MNFADRVHASIRSRKSVIIAGFDPVLESVPQFLKDESRYVARDDDAVRQTLCTFYEIALHALAPHIAAVKPNIAFFEQYGIGGLQALQWVCDHASRAGLPVVVDAKRGDIGTTAEAYMHALFGGTATHGGLVDADAITVSPFLGFETLAPFVKACSERHKGIFVLARTSNPGAADIQGLFPQGTQGDISAHVAGWIESQRERALGSCGYSSIGAVVGATNGDEAARMRTLMPHALFLIPGMGAQGGTARDALRSFTRSAQGDLQGGLINLSRALMSSFSAAPRTRQELADAFIHNAHRYNEEIRIAAVTL